MLKWIMILCFFYSAALHAETRVLAFSGSLREGSINRKLIGEVAQIARQQGAQVTVVDLREYAAPFYDGDLEATQGMPTKAKELRQLMSYYN